MNVKFDKNVYQVYLHVYYDGVYYYGKLCNTLELRDHPSSISMKYKVREEPTYPDGSIRVNPQEIMVENFTYEAHVHSATREWVKNKMPNCEKIIIVKNQAPIFKQILNKLKNPT